MINSIVLDTHIILWMLLEPEKIPETIKRNIIDAREANRLFISSISLWEIGMLQFKKRINVFVSLTDFLESISNIDGLTVVDISASIAAESVLLIDDFHGDPADRLIVATTRIKNATLITKDQLILSWANKGHMKYLSF